MSLNSTFCQQLLDLSLTNEDFEEFQQERSIKQSKVVSLNKVHNEI